MLKLMQEKTGVRIDTSGEMFTIAGKDKKARMLACAMFEAFLSEDLAIWIVGCGSSWTIGAPKVGSFPLVSCLDQAQNGTLNFSHAIFLSGAH